MTKKSMPSKRATAILVSALSVAALSTAVAPAATAGPGEITYTLHRVANPSADQLDAYSRITTAMDRAVARYNTYSDITKHLNVYYAPGVPTAEANINGDVRFGTNRGFMNERTALHETSHTIGVGQSSRFTNRCVSGKWIGQQATALVESWDGVGSRLSCGGGHVWPYGLNYNNEMSEVNAVRHVDLMEALLADGM